MLAGTGCQEPKTYDPQITVANADAYTFDFIMLAEWGGRIFSESGNKATIYIDPASITAKDKKFQQVISLNNNDKTSCTSFSAARYDFDSDSLAQLGIAGSTIPITVSPYPEIATPNSESSNTDYQIKLSCKKSTGTFTLCEQDADKDAKFIYDCEISRSGVAALNFVWKHFFASDQEQFFVASGDSYGVSQKVARSTDDIATAIMLNYLGLDVDTFGNHSFNDNIHYMQNIVDTAKYSYVASNVENVPQNLDNVHPYVMFDVKPDSGDANPLRLAVIGIIDKSITRAVFPGRFGSLAIDDIPCALVQTLEAAHNQGARAFFITGHLSIAEESTYKTLVTLLSLNGEKVENNGLDDINDDILKSISPEVCPSKLVIPENLSETKASYIEETRKHLFNEVAGVFAEAGDNILANVTSELLNHNRITINNEPRPFCSQKDNTLDCDKFQNYLEEHHPYDVLSASNKDGWEFSSENIRTALGQYSYALRMDDTLSKDLFDGVWYMQLATKGHATSRATFRAKKAETDKYGTDEYDVSLIEYQQEPVVAPAKDVVLIGQKVTKSYEEITPQDCVKESYALYNETDISEFHDGLLACLGTFACQYPRDIQESSDDSALFIDTYITQDPIESVYCASNNGILTLNKRSGTNQSGSSIAAIPDNRAETCLNTLVQISQIAKQKISIEKQAVLLTCLYRSKESSVCHLSPTNDLCKDDTNYSCQEYEDTILDKFPVTIHNHTKSSHRNYTTFLGNLIMDAIYNYYNNIPLRESEQIRFDASDPQNLEFDAVFMNSGTIRDMGAMDYITNANVRDLLPFGNKVSAISVSVPDFVKLIETNLWSRDGGFPAVSGALFSYVDKVEDKNEITEVTELWQVNYKQEIIRPLYLKDCPKDIDESVVKLSDPDRSFICTRKDDTIIIKLDVATTNENEALGYELKYNETRDGFFANINAIRIISSDFLFTGGDNYSLPTSARQLPISDDYVDNVIIKFLQNRTENSQNNQEQTKKIELCSSDDASQSGGMNNNTIPALFMKIWCKNRQFLTESKDSGHPAYTDPIIKNQDASSKVIQDLSICQTYIDAQG